jgi:hypothetical protein
MVCGIDVNAETNPLKALCMDLPIEEKAFCISVMKDVNAPLITSPIDAKVFCIDLTNPLKKPVIDDVM